MKHLLITLNNRSVESQGLLFDFNNPIRKFHSAFGRSLPRRNYRKQLWNLDPGIGDAVPRSVRTWISKARRELSPPNNRLAKSDLIFSERSASRTGRQASRNRTVRPSTHPLQVTVICHSAFTEEVIALSKWLRTQNTEVHFLGVFNTQESSLSLRDRAVNGIRYVHRAERRLRSLSKVRLLPNGKVHHVLSQTGLASELGSKFGLNRSRTVGSQLGVGSGPLASFGMLGLSGLSTLRALSGEALWQQEECLLQLYDVSELENLYEEMLRVARERGVPVVGMGVVDFARPIGKVKKSTVQPLLTKFDFHDEEVLPEVPTEQKRGEGRVIYVTQEGRRIYQTKGDVEHAVVVIRRAKKNGFLTAIDDLQNAEQVTQHDINRLRTFGDVYLIAGMEELYELSLINPIPDERNYYLDKSGNKPVIYPEWAAKFVQNGNVFSVDMSTKWTSWINDMIGGLDGHTIHTHPSLPSGLTLSGRGVKDGHPGRSHQDWMNSQGKAKHNPPRLFDVVIDENNIYFYRAGSSHPRKYTGYDKYPTVDFEVARSFYQGD